MTKPVGRRGATVAVLPIKQLRDAKQRLRGELTPAARRALARAMALDVLDALLAASLERVIVVTGEQEIASLAERRGCTVLREHHPTGLVPAARRGVSRALSDGAARVLLISGDLPALRADHVCELARMSAPAVIVPDRHGEGTNALLLTPPDLVAPAFGPGSFARHVAAIAASGRRATVYAPLELTHDIDVPADLALVATGVVSVGRRTRLALDRERPLPPDGGCGEA